MKKDFVFSSESVTEGHPDKLCDQVSDGIVDYFLKKDRFARIIAECAISTSIIFIAARFASDVRIDIPNLARRVIAEMGYYDRQDFSAATCSVLTSLQELPVDASSCFEEESLSEPDIEAMPAKDQVTVFGFACNQTAQLMPLPLYLAHKLSRHISSVRREKVISYLAPEAKTDVGVEYKNRRPHRIANITITASQSGTNTPVATLRDEIRELVVQRVFEDEPIKPDSGTEISINPEGPFHLGGPMVHSGLTGRKTGMDTYGEYSRHSGAALSGKDPLRIDRVGAYAARYAAKNIVAAGLADECELQLSYAISRSRPISIQVETFGTGKVSDARLAALVEKNFEFRLAGIVRQFNLRQLPSLRKDGFYRKLAAYGHMGRTEIGAPWEQLNMVEKLLEFSGTMRSKRTRA